MPSSDHPFGPKSKKRRSPGLDADDGPASKEPSSSRARRKRFKATSPATQAPAKIHAVITLSRLEGTRRNCRPMAAPRGIGEPSRQLTDAGVMDGLTGAGRVVGRAPHGEVRSWPGRVALLAGRATSVVSRSTVPGPRWPRC
jgi:hypothetical protein